MAAPWIVNGQLWAVIESLLPVKALGTRGPARMNDRLVLQGILFVLITGIGWEDLPQEWGFGSGMTCRRRLREWQAAGVFEAIHTSMLANFGDSSPDAAALPARCRTRSTLNEGGCRRLAPLAGHAKHGQQETPGHMG
ncbi:transposase [Nocardia sp. NPDC057272]|uniref:transposase n=1 Tax=Nocardia sp. NPDC057272 TaxID=3346079 RepID=UPI003626C326